MKNLLFLLFFPILMMAQTKEPLFQSFDGTKIYYEVSGEGKPVVLLHGFMSNLKFP